MVRNVEKFGGGGGGDIIRLLGKNEYLFVKDII